MLRPEERQNYILQAAKEKGFASISDIAEKLDVSIETVRRDINKLCEDNLVKKVRGGAVPNKVSCRKDADFLLRVRSNQHAKLTIAMEAASLIRDGSVVAFDAGASIQPIANCITGVKNVTFITNSISTASILLDKFHKGEVDGRIIFVGGEIDIKNRFSKGASATRSIMDYYFDISFVSCTAFSYDSVSSYNLDECSYSKQLIERSSFPILIADSDKFGKNSVCSFAKISDFSKIITDDQVQIPGEFKEQCDNANTELVIVSV
jgi:DeoR/GlpR family transcriptional regulator of sugar metabolism